MRRAAPILALAFACGVPAAERSNATPRPSPAPAHKPAQAPTPHGASAPDTPSDHRVAPTPSPLPSPTASIEDSQGVDGGRLDFAPASELSPEGARPVDDRALDRLLLLSIAVTDVLLLAILAHQVWLVRRRYVSSLDEISRAQSEGRSETREALSRIGRQIQDLANDLRTLRAERGSGTRPATAAGAGVRRSAEAPSPAPRAASGRDDALVLEPATAAECLEEDMRRLCAGTGSIEDVVRTARTQGLRWGSTVVGVDDRAMTLREQSDIGPVLAFQMDTGSPLYFLVLKDGKSPQAAPVGAFESAANSTAYWRTTKAATAELKDNVFEIRAPGRLGPSGS
jgi:hypothetical protein